MPYAESINVPFIMRYPSKIPAGKNNIFIESVDIFPTLFGLMGLEIPETVQGRNLSEYIQEKQEPTVNRAFSSAYISRKLFLEEYEKCGKDLKKSGWRCMTTPEYKYVIEKGYFPNNQVRYWLFDKMHDPYEIQPYITQDYQENPVMVKLHKELCDHLIEIGDMIYLQ